MTLINSVRSEPGPERNDRCAVPTGGAQSDATIETLALDAIGHVPWWPGDRSEVTLHRILVHMIAGTHRHAGHADIVRELIDGATRLRAGNNNVPRGNPAWWENYRSRLEHAAAEAPGRG